MKPLVIVGLLVGYALAGCGGDSETPIASGPYADLEAPTLLASGDAINATWSELSRTTANVEPAGDGAGAIPGFEPFNDPHIALSDGRLLVRGRSEADEAIPGWYQRSPASLAEGEDNPVIATLDRPVRIFVFDPDNGELVPVSHVPEVHAYTTAMSEGESPDVVLDVIVLTGEHAVAYTSGFSGAAYDVVYEVYVAPIPTALDGAAD